MGIIAACLTDTETTQEAPAARLPPVREIAVVPAVAVSVPPQVFEVTAGVVICNPEAGTLGKMSMKLRPVMGTVAVFVIVKTTVTTLPFVVGLGTNCLVNVGAAKGPGGKPIMLGEGLGVGRGGVDGSPTPVPPGSVFGFCTGMIGPGSELIGFLSLVC